MELLLALAVITAVILFGALISLGNERQRRAIDELREQVVLWAIQDLRIKREHLAQEVRVDDPLGWFNTIATKVFGQGVNLQVVEVIDVPMALICASADGTKKIIFSPLSLNDIHQIRRNKISRLSQYADRNPLLSISRQVRRFELSALNNGVLFDLELTLAWKGLTNHEIGQAERLWVYVIV